MAVLNIKKDDFQRVVLESEKPVLLDFWASWCGPCKLLAPVLDEFAADHPQFNIVKANVDEESELARRFRVMAVPTLIVFKDGKEAARKTGLLDEDELLELLEN